MIQINNFIGSNDNLKIVEQRGIFTIFQHNTDMSVNRMEAQEKYFMQQMGVVPKQVAITLQDNAIRLKPGLMQFMFGNIQQTSGVTGVGVSPVTLAFTNFPIKSPTPMTPEVC